MSKSGSKSKKSKLKLNLSNNLKFNKLLNFKLLIKKLTEFNHLFPLKPDLNEKNLLLNQLNQNSIHSSQNSHHNSHESSNRSSDKSSNNSSNKSSDTSLDKLIESPLTNLSSKANQSTYSFYKSSSSSLNFLSAILFILLLSLLTDLVFCDHINLPPRFVVLPGYSPDIVLTIKEGNSSLNKALYVLGGEDPNGDKLRFGVLGPIGNDILRIENDVPTSNQATIYLKKELDRETQPSYSLVLTLTDGKLAGSFVSFSCFF